MPDPCQIRVYDKQALVYAGEFVQPVELGRQSREDEALYQPRWDRDHWRVAVAPAAEQELSRRYLHVEPLTAGRARIGNLSTHLPLRLVNGCEVAPGTACETVLPVQLTLGGRTIHVRPPGADEPPLQALSLATQVPDSQSLSARAVATLARTAAAEGSTLVRWLQTALDVLQSAATSSDFFGRAAAAAVDLAGLGACRVLIRHGDEWRTEAVRPAVGAEPNWRPSREVLDRVCREKRTFWQGPGESRTITGSLVGVQAVVAAPVLDRQGNVIGLLYGDSHGLGDSRTPPRVGRQEALLLELLAGVMAAGLARLEQERAALAAQIRLEQFFTTEVARQLIAQPELLRGRDVEITVLFCDVRGFSRISEKLGPARTVEWLGAVMEALSECVLGHRGVVVDHVGDELVAMWGAPDEQPEHARLACRAALAMRALLGPLNARWQPVVQEPLEVGIGVNTGVARVGNTGSQRKPKYGPLGNAVNLASRVEGATKHLKVPLLVTGATRARLGEEFALRRLGQARVVNIAEAVDLYQLAEPGRAGWDGLKRGYEEALERFARGDFRGAIHILGRMIVEYPDDRPSQILLSRAVIALDSEAARFDPVWEVPGK